MVAKMPRLPLYVRLGAMPPKKWLTLNECCQLAKSSSKSYVKMTLFAMPNIESRQVSHVDTPLKGNHDEKWMWQFRRIEDTP